MSGAAGSSTPSEKSLTEADLNVPTLSKEEGTEASSRTTQEKATSKELNVPSHGKEEADNPPTADDASSTAAYALEGVSWKLQLAALFCVVFLAMGEYVADASLSPLKSTLKKEMPEVTNARYGAISSASHLVKGIMPIIAGMIVDYWGPSYISLGCTVTLLIGAIARALGGQYESFGAILGGEIIASFGAAFIDLVQNKLYTHWFRGTKANGGNRAFLGLVLGIDLAGRNIFQLLGSLTAIPLAQSTGKWYWSFWLGAIVCALSVGINLTYLYIERRLPAKARIPTGREAMVQRRRKIAEPTTSTTTSPMTLREYVTFHLKGITQSISTMPSFFYIMAMTQVLQSGVIGAFSSNRAEVIELTRGTTKLVAGYTSSIALIIPIVLTPCIGLLFDRFGKRMLVGTLQAALWCLVMVLLAYTSVHPLIPIVLSSFASSAQLLPFYGSIPIIVQSQTSIATAFGIWKAFNSNGSTIVDIATGAIQDESTARGKRQYDYVFALMLAIKAYDVFVVIGYHFVDKYKFAGILNMSEKKRVQLQLQETEEQAQSGLRKPIKAVTYCAIAMFTALFVTAYTIFIVYSWTA